MPLSDTSEKGLEALIGASFVDEGGLDWPDVKSRIEGAFTAIPPVRVLLFAPASDDDEHSEVAE